MKPAICAGFDYGMPFPQAVRMIAEAGFQVVSIGARPSHSGYDTTSGRAAIRKLIAENRMTIDSLHAPFPEGDQLFSLEENQRLESIRQCRIALDATAEIEGRITVIHLIQPYGIPRGNTRDRMIQQGRRSVAVLAQYAVRKDVKLALENGQEPEYDEVLADLLDEFRDQHVGFCYDSWHENVQGTCFRMLERFGDRLLTTHIHDNRGSDIHVLPREGTIDWSVFQRVLSRLSYSGNLLLEVSIHDSAFKDHAEFLAESKRRAEQLLRSDD